MVVVDVEVDVDADVGIDDVLFGDALSVVDALPFGELLSLFGELVLLLFVRLFLLLRFFFFGGLGLELEFELEIDGELLFTLIGDAFVFGVALDGVLLLLLLLLLLEVEAFDDLFF